jgi:hypothetical protein
MMTMVRYDMLAILDEKVWNARINTWIRAPGSLFGAFILYSVSINPTERAEFVNRFVCTHSQKKIVYSIVLIRLHTYSYTRYMTLLVAALCYTNGLYYMQQVTLSTARKDKNYSC